MPGHQRHIFLCSDQTKPKCCDKELSLESWDYLKRRLAELGLLDRVNRQRADRIDTKLIEITAERLIHWDAPICDFCNWRAPANYCECESSRGKPVAFLSPCGGR